MSSFADKSTLVFDGDCGFCFASVNFLKSWGYKGQIVEYQSYLNELQKFSLSIDQAKEGSILISESGQKFLGVNAILEGMARSHLLLKFLAVVLKFYPFKRFSESVYSWVASNRMFLSAFPTACGLSNVESEIPKNNYNFKPSTFFVVLGIFCMGQFLLPAILILLRVIVVQSDQNDFQFIQWILWVTHAFTWRMYS